MKIPKEKIPKERIPEFIIENNCCMFKKIDFIHHYKDFNEIIVNPFIELIKPEFCIPFKNTCKHMFKKVGYGVFVFILNGNIHTYQVFANTTEIKPGSNKITKTKIINYKKQINKTKKYQNTKFLKDKKIWGFSNCMVNCKKNWWDKFYTLLYFDMLQSCLKNSKITTCFFINLYDFPVLYNRQCEQNILNELTCKNNPKEYNNYIPVLSGTTTKDYYDKCLVYADSWEIACQKKYWNQNECKNRYDNTVFNAINTKWDTKKDELIFRGKNNSCYQNDFEKNDRLKVLKGLKELFDENKIPEKININVGLTELSHKTIFIDNKLNMSDEKAISKELGNWSNIEKMSMVEQSNNKYILNIDGYTTAWRLSCELSYNSCIILLKSKYESWFYDKLHHMKNIYLIDVESKKLEDDLHEALQLFSKDDRVGKKIAKGGKDLYDKIMNIKYIKKYLISLLSDSCFDIMMPLQ